MVFLSFSFPWPAISHTLTISFYLVAISSRRNSKIMCKAYPSGFLIIPWKSCWKYEKYYAHNFIITVTMKYYENLFKNAWHEALLSLFSFSFSLSPPTIPSALNFSIQSAFFLLSWLYICMKHFFLVVVVFIRNTLPILRSNIISTLLMCADVVQT